MKKIFTLLLASIIVFTSSVFAQPGTVCNAEFTFTVNGSSGNVQFAPAITTIAVQHNWSFGDGGSSNTIAPSHVYAPGTYNVVHVVAYRSPNDSNTVQCTDSAVRLVTVTGQDSCNIHASFSFIRDSVQTNKVYFTNLSTGINPNTITRWSFGDGTVSYDNNPAHIYQTSGAYTVCLFVQGDSLCTDDTCSIVQVQVPNTTCNLVAGFTFRADSLPGTPIPPYIFVNTSTPLTTSDSSFWYFGDGTPVVINPATPFVHAFTSPGVYIVCLKVKKVQPGTTNVICERQICQTILIDTVQTQCNLQAYFAHRADSINTNKIYFTNYSAPLASTDSIRWTFGDGSTSADVNPVHIYNVPGTYTVCLRVKKAQAAGTAPCVREYCKTIIVQQVMPCNIHAAFSFVRDSVQINKVYFTNLSTVANPNTIVRWNFGDGTSSSDNNPIHIYQASGAYTVCLTVRRDSLCADDTCAIVQVQVPNTCNLVVNFSTAIDSLHSNVFHFINQSMPLSATDSVTWNFGDGSSSHDFLNTTHTYTQGGVFNVCLVIKKNNSAGTPQCVREFCQPVIVDTPQTACNLQAYFFTRADSINHNKVYFINQSTPVASTDSIRWTFGDGSGSSDVNPVHTYSAAGAYTVCLRVKKVQVPGTVACVSEYCKTIVIENTSVCNQLQVNFNWHADSSNNNKIFFINQSSPLTANTFANWSFGDGDSSMSANPVHIYAQPGTYTVCLNVRMANCSKDTCQTIVVLPSTTDSCHINPSFNTQLDSANRRKVYFINTTAAASAATNAMWNFGDGTTGTGWNPDHVYSMPGWYLVCVTVTTNNTCSRTHCDSVFVPGNVVSPVVCDTFQLSFGYRQDDYMPNKFFFFATGNAPLYNQQWTFSGINDTSSVTIYQSNPVYVFPDTGYYRVCVRGYFSTNCYREFCDYIRINSTNAPSQCVVNSYPNPAHDNVSFHIQLDAPGNINTVVANTQGVVLMQYSQQGVTGNNLVTLNVSNLACGFYSVKIMYNGRVCYTRFQKI